MRALVTGGTGLIGAQIVRALVDRGYEVRALVRDRSRAKPIIPPSVTGIDGDILHSDLTAACADCDVVFHSAAHFAYVGVSPATLHDTAVLGTERLLHACAHAKVPRIVVTSSSVVFGYRHDARETNETQEIASTDDDAPYIVAKIAQHRHALRLATQLKLDVRLACPTMALGPTSGRLGPSNGLIVAYLADPFGCTFSGGCNLVSARDVAIGHALIAERGTAGESYLLGSQNMTWHEIHAAIAEIAGVSSPKIWLNHTLGYVAAAVDELRARICNRPPLTSREQAAMIGRYYWYSHAKAAGIGYAPAPARDALVDTISWLVTTPNVSRETRIDMRLSNEVYHFRARANA